MTVALLGTLAVLALIDSTSFGTLLIPIWLLTAPGRVRVGAILTFLSTVAAFYLLLGFLLVAGVVQFSDQLSDAIDTTPVRVVQVALGAALLGAGIWIGSRKNTGESGRLLQWRERAVGESGSTRGLMALALTAAVVEAASMVPYLAAIGLMGTADVSWPVTALLLVGYCIVMILPALVLLLARIGLGDIVKRPLEKINDWMMRNGRENTAWILGIIGVFLAVNGLENLGVIDQGAG